MSGHLDRPVGAEMGDDHLFAVALAVDPHPHGGAHQLVRHQTNMPKSGKPWFPLQLLEGPAAVRRGRYMQIVAGLMTIPLLWITCVLFPDVLQLFLVSPSGLKVC